MDSFPCDYLTVTDLGVPWVRAEQCRMFDGVIYIGSRPEPRTSMQTEQAKCRDSEKKTHVRYRIGEKEWVCVLKEEK